MIKHWIHEAIEFNQSVNYLHKALRIKEDSIYVVSDFYFRLIENELTREEGGGRRGGGGGGGERERERETCLHYCSLHTRLVWVPFSQ